MPDEKRFTDSGIEIKNIYTNQSGSENFFNKENLNDAAGEFSFYKRNTAWYVPGQTLNDAQYAGFSTVEESNKRYHYLLLQGVSVN